MRIGVSGHQRIPPQAIAPVRARITTLVAETKGNVVGVSSLAAGADQLFATVILENGGRLHAVIPCEDYETTFADNGDLERFRDLVGRADKVEVLNYDRPSQEAFMNAGRYVVENSDLLIAIWDGKPARGHGGTADVVEFARRRRARIEVIWPRGVTR